jgi:drug/metabolite transporter (DMT)-like permease
MIGFWIIWVAVLLNTVNKLYTKFILNRVSSFWLLFWVNMVAGFISLPFLFIYWQDVQALTFVQLTFVLLTASLWSVNGYLGNLSVEKAEVSIREPLAQLQVIWAVLIGVFVFGEVLNLQEIIGILLIISAGMVLVLRKNLFEAHIDKNSLSIVLIYTVVTAIVAAMDKQVVSFLRPEVYLFFSFSVPIIFIAPFISKNKNTFASVIKYKLHISAISIIFLCVFLSTITVYKNFDFALAYPLLKIATPLTALLGIIIFHEKKDLKRKFLAISLATLGAIVIKVNF